MVQLSTAHALYSFVHFMSRLLAKFLNVNPKSCFVLSYFVKKADLHEIVRRKKNVFAF